MDDKNIVDAADRFVPYDELSDRLKQLENITQLQRAIENLENFETEAEIKTYPFVMTHVSWRQRLLGWFGQN